MAPPRKPAPKSAAPSAPRGDRARPPQGEAGRGRGPRSTDGANAPRSATGRGRPADDASRSRSPDGAAPRGPRNVADGTTRTRSPEGMAPRSPRGAGQFRTDDSRNAGSPRSGRDRIGEDASRGRSAEGFLPRPPRGANAPKADAARDGNPRAGRGRPANEPAKTRHSYSDAPQPRFPDTVATNLSDADARRELRRNANRKPIVAADLPVEPAKKMLVRHGNEKHEAHAIALREKRVEAKYIGDLRIQKALALSGVGSRRDCDEWVAAGRVSIDGQIALPGARVSMGARVLVDGKPIQIKWPDRLPRIVMYHKQEGEIVSRDDPEGRTTVFERLPKVQSSAWIAVGRLDFNTSGLLIFTTSGDLANRLMHPSFEVQREYAVRVLGQLTDEQKKAMVTGIPLDDGEARFEMLEDQGGEGMNHWYRVILREGRNREVRRMFEHFELTVSRLMRVRFGMLAMPSRLKRGQYYELDEPEVLAVLKWAGLSMTGRVPTR